MLASYLFRSLGAVLGVSLASALVQGTLRSTLLAQLKGEDVEEVMNTSYPPFKTIRN